MINPITSPPSDFLRNWLNKILNRIFRVDPITSNLRKIVFVLSTILVWLSLAFLFRNIGLTKDLGLNYAFLSNYPKFKNFLNFIHILFSLNVIFFLSLITIAYRLALNLSAAFLAHNFMIANEKTARLRILFSAFSNSHYETIVVENGNLKTFSETNLFSKLGGPAQVEIISGSAAVFERPDGTTEILAPAFNGKMHLGGFEKLRALFDLRDQSTSLSIFCRTKDGVPIYIKDLKLFFNCKHGSTEDRNSNTLITNLDAIYWMTYNLPNQPWHRYFIDQFQKQFSNFVASKNLVDIINFSSGMAKERNTKVINEYFEKRLAELSKRSRYHPNLPQEIQAKYIRRHHLQIKRKSSVRFELQKKTTHFPLIPPENRLIKPKLAMIFYKEFRDSFQEAMRHYAFQFDWIDYGSLFLPKSIQPNDINQFIQQLDWKSNLQAGDLPRSLEDWNECVYLSRMLQVYKKHIRFPAGKFIPPTEKEINHLLQDYQSQINSATKLYQKNIGKVPKKITIIMDTLKSIKQNTS